MTYQSLARQLCLSAVLLSLSAALATAATTFDKEVIATDLNRPTGILALRPGQLYFTEIPDPGVFGAGNTVKRLFRNGRTRVISAGEPAPTNLAASSRQLYWTCQTAGVILAADRRGRGDPSMFATDLSQPTGLARSWWGTAYTEVPSPGQAGAGNAVRGLFFDRIPFTISLGEPEPADVVISPSGLNVFWTCTTAGVIVHKNLLTGQQQVLYDDLDAPVGLAMHGPYLYWTEVPSPGVAGADNEVWRVNLYTGQQDLISQGEPQPQDVSVDSRGHIYWTCTTAGVIIKATPRSHPSSNS